MKDWAADHPKAKVMARKRAAIVAAAQQNFLAHGYGGTSMEAIADAAGVSIMTLYRHAETKDDLFAAVIASACDPNDEAEMAEFERLMKKPLREVLVQLGIVAQQRLARAETVALLRAVMGETARFPHLAEVAYEGLVGHLERMIDQVLAMKDESAGLSKAERKKQSAAFIDRLVGKDMLRMLLGLRGASHAEERQRAEAARDEVMAALEQVPDSLSA